MLRTQNAAFALVQHSRFAEFGDFTDVGLCKSTPLVHADTSFSRRGNAATGIKLALAGLQNRADLNGKHPLEFESQLLQC